MEVDLSLVREGSRIDPLAGGGETGALMRSIDWSKTAVGPVGRWPQSLRTALSILMETHFPMYIAWGSSYTQFYNDGYRPILGSTKHPAAMGRSSRETFAESWHIIGPMFDGVMRGNAVGSEDWMLPLDRNGFLEECYFIFSYSPIRDESGEVGGVLVTVTETTARVLGERRLETLRALSSQTQEVKTTDAACQVAADVLSKSRADVPFALIYLIEEDGKRARLAGLTGVDRGSAAAPEVIDLDRDPMQSLAEVAHSGEPRLLEHVAADLVPLAEEGGWSPVNRVLILPIIHSGEAAPSGILVAGTSPKLSFDEKYRSFLELVASQIGTSLANVRALVEARERAESLAEIDRAKTAFFSNVSHEFRTPLTLMLGPTEDALADEAVQHGDRERWQLVHRNALRLLKLVNSLLDFSRLEARRVEVAYVPVDLDVVTGDLASVFRSAVERAGLRLVIDLEPLGAPVYLDLEMWEKVVFNLLSNALKFTFEGEIALTLKRDGGDAVLTVRDTGVGVPQSEVPHLFTRFHRVQGTRARTLEGTGIGLALVRELVRLHGGSIDVSSIVDEGTTFTVRIPFGTAHLQKDHVSDARPAAASRSADAYLLEAERWLPQTGTPAELPPSGVRRARILLADDNADMREYMERVLGTRWDVRTVVDGNQALEVARKNPPDIILTDVMMPGLNGFQLLQGLRDDPRTRAIPVIFLSARAGEEARVEGMQAGADDYLVKPFSARELLARVGARIELSRLRIEAEAAHQRMYSHFMQAPVAVSVVLGPDFVYDLANPSYEEMVGRKGIVGKPLREAFPELPDDAPVLEMLRSVYSTGVPFQAEEFAVLLARNGKTELEETFFKFTCAPLRDVRGEVTGIMTVAVDVTEQVRARRNVEEAHALLETVVNQMPAGVIIAEAPSGRTLLANRKVQDILGYPALRTDSVEDFRAYTAVHPDGRPFEPEEYALTRALHGITVIEEEVSLIHRDGSARTLAVSAAPVQDADGRIIAAINVFTDISDRKRGEEERRAALVREQQARADAEVANRAKDEFLAMLGHELRNPLAPILTALQLSRLRGDEGLRERGVIERQVDHLVRLVDDLLDVSRITGGKVELRKEPVEIVDVVARGIEMASPLIEARQHKLEVDVPRRGFAVEGDTTRLAQVLSNLLTNAAKYTEPHGRLTIRAALEEGNVVVRVRDNGMGLSPEMLPRVFDLFVQERQSIERAQGGLGLGLAIVRSLVLLHGGTVEAFSEGRGKGAEFVVRLPHVASEAATKAARIAPAIPVLTGTPHPTRVLVVDDNEDAATLLLKALRRMGFVVEAAYDGPAALRIANEFCPEVAVLDIGLPVMDGYELGRHLRAMPGLEAIRLIAVTGYGQDADRLNTSQAGFDEHLVKPIGLDRLAAVIERLRPKV